MRGQLFNRGIGNWNKTLKNVPHILGLARNVRSINKMCDIDMHIIFEKDSHKKGHCAKVLVRDIWIGTL